MKQQYTIHALSEIINGLAHADIWLKSKRMRLQNTRFSKIREILAQVHDPADPSNEQCLAMIQANAILVICQELSKLNGSQLPLKRLKAAIGGPLHPRSERKDGATIQARNAMFELELAARLAQQGLDPQAFGDIRFQLEGTHFYVECKRPLGEKNLSTNVEKAFSQLVTSMADDPDARGIVALAVDRLIGSTCSFWKVTSREQLNDVLKGELEKFRDRNEPHWQSPPDPRINALLVCLNYVAVVQDQGRQALVGFITGSLPLRRDAAYQLLAQHL